MKRRFIMLAGLGMIGKSTAAKRAASVYPDAVVLENDKLMHDVFRIARMEKPTEWPINKVLEWRAELESRVDGDRLIRLLHRDYVARHWNSPTIIAEGYTYMLAWYRQQVHTGLGHLGEDFEFSLLKYSPPGAMQIERRNKKAKSMGYSVKTYEFREQELKQDWAAFEAPTEALEEFNTVDDGSLDTFMRNLPR